MSDTDQAESPLTGIDWSIFNNASGVNLQELPFQGHLNLRGRPDESRFTNAVIEVLGFAPPLRPNTYKVVDSLKMYWLGPDEWLIITPMERQADLEAEFDKALQGLFSSVIDISSGQTIISITGPDAGTLIQKGCPMDLHPSVFRPGDCAQTLLGKTGVLLSVTGDPPTYELVVRRSFSDYLGLWLLDAVEEF
ncbi:MAG: sarcosine oxidase subunit gamma [Gammaproteobacteria bacterium]|nr:sarcosine oxidase subunit gamma [Gammaproteobacteria bacterium]